ncbi:YHYH protein [Alteromonas portus]|uniref:YHYH protein n=1 Tax=Alteromonas portus TaxID=2565549 RepID=A0A4U0ZC07_9ALTE|nr:YHYH protein [Alteromonas portus]TKB02087.1 YHYH protein [Alteromonas portus]
MLRNVTLLTAGLLILSACGDHGPEGHSHDQDANTGSRIGTFFSEDIKVAEELVPCTLTDKTETQCYLITVPGKREIGHDLGPWCPRNIEDTAEDSGIWLDNNKVYDADGEFIANLATFYSDDKWQLYNPETGEVKVTDSKDACLAAARPDVDPEYQNYCVECAPEYFEDDIPTQQYVIPAFPQKLDKAAKFDAHGGMGLAFNGVKMDAPAPVDAILGAHTLAPFDDCGGHVNPFVGYHYHAMTDCAAHEDSSSPNGKLLGVAFDGFTVFGQLNSDGSQPEGLDSCGGHSDEIDGYHYHAADPGKNKILGCFSGAQGCSVEGDTYNCSVKPKGPPPGGEGHGKMGPPPKG